MIKNSSLHVSQDKKLLCQHLNHFFNLNACRPESLIKHSGPIQICFAKNVMNQRKMLVAKSSCTAPDFDAYSNTLLSFSVALLPPSGYPTCREFGLLKIGVGLTLTIR